MDMSLSNLVNKNNVHAVDAVDALCIIIVF